MWSLIKNDPILKAISVFILGIFAFSFAFSIMFGSGQGNMEHGESSGGYNVANSLSSIVILLSKLLIIIALIAIIIAMVKFIQKSVIGNEPIKGIETLKNKPLSAIIVGILGVIILLFLSSIIMSSNNSSMVSYSTNYSNNMYGFGTTSILALVVKLIVAISLIGLIAGLIMYFKTQYFTNVKSIATINREVCTKCGFELKEGWNCCPSCGIEKNANDKIELSDDELNISLENNEEK